MQINKGSMLRDKSAADEVAIPKDAVWHPYPETLGSPRAAQGSVPGPPAEVGKVCMHELGLRLGPQGHVVMQEMWHGCCSQNVAFVHM